MSYATPAQLRTQIDKAGTTGAGSDTNLQLLLNAATEAIDGFCNWGVSFEADTTASARYYPGSGRPYQRIDPCVEVTAVAVKDSPSDDENAYTAWVVGAIGTTTSADVFPCTGDPAYPRFGATPYTLLIVGPNGDYSLFTTGKFTTRGGFRPSSGIARGFPTVKATAKWGYAVAAPDHVIQACLTQAARWFKRGESGWSDVLTNAEMGILSFRQDLDPDIKMMLVNGRLVRPSIGRR